MFWLQCAAFKVSLNRVMTVFLQLKLGWSFHRNYNLNYNQICHISQRQFLTTSWVNMTM